MVVVYPLVFSQVIASGYLSSGRSPKVNKASEQPSACALVATVRTCSGERYSSSDSDGSCLNVQYPQKSRHNRVSGMKTLGENVMRLPLP